MQFLSRLQNTGPASPSSGYLRGHGELPNQSTWVSLEVSYGWCSGTKVNICSAEGWLEVMVLGTLGQL